MPTKTDNNRWKFLHRINYSPTKYLLQDYEGLIDDVIYAEHLPNIDISHLEPIHKVLIHGDRTHTHVCYNNQFESGSMFMFGHQIEQKSM